MTHQDKPLSLTMLLMHRRIDPRALGGFVAGSMYVRILAELVKSKRIHRGEVWIHGEQDHTQEYQGVTVRTVSDFSAANLGGVDVLFVRGDKKVYLPLLSRSTVGAKRLLFYGASGRGIPRHGARFHGVLVDDREHAAHVHAYYPGVYVGEFLKTANSEVFCPQAGAAKQYDVCLTGSMDDHRKNLASLRGMAGKLGGLKFVICGRVSQETVDMLGGSGDQITRAGFVSHPELNTIMNQSRLAVIPSNQSDASPRIILEYMAAGTPILANIDMCGGAKFILPQAGRLAPTAEFGKVIPEMLGALETYDARKVFDQHFSPAKVADDFAGHLQGVWQMPDEPPMPSWRGRFARLLRRRVDRDAMKVNG